DTRAVASPDPAFAAAGVWSALRVGRFVPPLQPTPRGAAAQAETAAHPLRPTVPVELLPAPVAAGVSPALRHVRLAAALRPGPDLGALPLPDGAVAVTGADESVGDLVQNGVEDVVHPVALDEMHGQLDRARLVEAHAEGSPAAVPAER